MTAFNEKTTALEVAAAFPDAIRGKTILITGVNKAGIGFTTAQALASQSPAHLILAGRTPSKLEDSITALRATYPNVDYRALTLDLGRQKAVRAAATELLSWTDIPQIDILINSAGIMNIPERTLSEDGIEVHFATNHIGHFLFTNLIMPKLLASASTSTSTSSHETSSPPSTRIINVTSLSPTVTGIRWSDINFNVLSRDLPASERPNYDYVGAWGIPQPEDKAYIPIEGYGQSKCANVLFSVGLNARLLNNGKGIVSYACHPGVIMTELSRDVAPETMAALRERFAKGEIPIKTLEEGAATSVFCAVAGGEGVGVGVGVGVPREGEGTYFIDCMASEKVLAKNVDPANAERLWGVSEEMVGEEFAW